MPGPLHCTTPWGPLYSIWMVILFKKVVEKEWNMALCSNVDGTRECDAKWNKPYRERQIAYVFTLFFQRLFIFGTERDRAWTGEGQRERGRHRIRNRLQALSHQPRARRGARTHGPRDRDLAEVGRLTDCATQAPHLPLLNTKEITLRIFPYTCKCLLQKGSFYLIFNFSLVFAVS